MATRELALRFVLPEHQSTTIPPFLRKLGAKSKKGRKQHEGKRYQTWLPAHKGRLKQRTSIPNPAPSQKGGKLQGTAIEKD